jgi:hypothetical protein
MKDCSNASAGKPETDREFILRNTSRTLSYVNHIFLLEGIVKREYSEEVLLFRNNGVDVEDAKGKSEREGEVRSIFQFRHMVAAHTVFSAPRKGDNIAAEVSSIFNLNSSIVDPGDISSFSIGGTGIALADESPSRGFPRVGIKDSHIAMEKHFKAWGALFSQAIEKFEKENGLDKNRYVIRTDRITSDL